MATILDETGFVILDESGQSIFDQLGDDGSGETPGTPVPFGSLVLKPKGKISLTVKFSGRIVRSV